MNESKISARSHNPQEGRLDSLFRSYRTACEPREVSVNFMPELWQRIEKAQNATFSFRRIAKGFVAVAAMLSVVLAVVSFLPLANTVPIYSSTWVDTLAAQHEALAAHSSSESIEYFLDLIHPDLMDDASEI